MARATAVEKVKRDRDVVTDRLRGLRWATIAERHRISERHARLVFRQALEAEPLDPHADPVEALREEVARLDAVIEELVRVADEAMHDAVRLGAVKARLAAMGQRTVLLQLAGVLPTDRREVRDRFDVRWVVDRMIEVGDRHGFPAEAKVELLELFRPRVGARGG